MGAVILAAAADGWRTHGTSVFFQVMLIGFGIHGFGHLGQSALTGGYTPGVLTAPTIVIPFAWWAWHTLGAGHVVGPDTPQNIALAVVGLLVVLPGIHGLTFGILRVTGHAARGAR